MGRRKKHSHKLKQNAPTNMHNNTDHKTYKTNTGHNHTADMLSDENLNFVDIGIETEAPIVGVTPRKRLIAKRKTQVKKPADTPQPEPNEKHMRRVAQLTEFTPEHFNIKSIYDTIPHVQPVYWDTPDRKSFPEWVRRNFSTFNTAKPVDPKPPVHVSRFMQFLEFFKLGSTSAPTPTPSETEPEPEPETPLKSSEIQTQLFNYNKIQQLIRAFMNDNNPARGILLYYALGAGKTCSSIAIAEAYAKNVVVLSNAGLQTNYTNSIRKCGALLLRTANYWDFYKCADLADANKLIDKLIAANLILPPDEIITTTKTAINITKTTANTTKTTANTSKTDNKTTNNATTAILGGGGAGKQKTAKAKAAAKAKPIPPRKTQKKGPQAAAIEYNIVVTKQRGRDIIANYILTAGGIFLPNTTKFALYGSNYAKMYKVDRLALDKQLNMLMQLKYTFLHLDDTRIVGKLTATGFTFDNKVVIVDEAHNLGNNMTSTSKRGELIYNLMMSAKNAKFIFLSGTPLVNSVFESTKLFNILRGQMHTISIRIKPLTSVSTSRVKAINWKAIRWVLERNKYVDSILVDETNNIIKLTKTPDSFKTVRNADGVNIGLVKDEYITDMEFDRRVLAAVENMGYIIKSRVDNESCFPDGPNAEELFNHLYYDSGKNVLKNTDTIQVRINGLASYYGYQDNSAYPKLNGPINIVQVPMSRTQLVPYFKYRQEEIAKDFKMHKPKYRSEIEQNFVPSFRVKSRLICSFTFPAEIGDPYDGDNIEALEDVDFMVPVNKAAAGSNDIISDGEIFDVDKLGGVVDDLNIKIDNIIPLYTDAVAEAMDNNNSSGGDDTNVAMKLKKQKEIISKIRLQYMQQLRENSHQYMNISNGSLYKYSPKYVEIIKAIRKSAGTVLVYSYFKTTIGLNTFAIALEENENYRKLLLMKVKTGRGTDAYQWQIDPTCLHEANNPGPHSTTHTHTVRNIISADLEFTGDENMDEPIFNFDDAATHTPHTQHAQHTQHTQHKPTPHELVNIKYYAMYTGSETQEEREIYRLIFNSEWHALEVNPKYAAIVPQLKYILDVKHVPHDEANKYGKVLNVLMTTKTGSEGLDLRNVRTVIISESHWQTVLINQVIGRAVRLNSHMDLPPSDRNVTVYLFLSTFGAQSHVINKDVRGSDQCKYEHDALNKFGQYITSDEYLYIISEKKKNIIEKFQMLIKNSAFDCALNYADNKQMPGNSRIKCYSGDVISNNDGNNKGNSKDNNNVNNVNYYDRSYNFAYLPNIDDIKGKYYKLGGPVMLASEYAKFATQSKIASVELDIYGNIYRYCPFPDGNGQVYIYGAKDEKMAGPVMGKLIYKDGKIKVGLK